MTAFLAFMKAGFRRWSTYRQAMVAGIFTNTVFGFLRVYVLLAVIEGSGQSSIAGYDAPRIATFVWVGQGLLASVRLWNWTELSDRVRTGDVAGELLRPVDLYAQYLATDLGRGGFMLLTRFIAPIAVGAMAFDLYAPGPSTYPLFAVSILLAILVGFSLRFLSNLAAFWLVEIRGVLLAIFVATSLGSGVAFPIGFLPSWLATTLRVATPFPSLIQAPLDVITEQPQALPGVGLQVVWAAIMATACLLVQRRAVNRLVIQGG